MLCPNCSYEIPDRSRFCPECGTQLAQSREGQPQPVDRYSLLQNYIPPELAKKILAAGKQIESERRHVTVLFADVTGFTALSEKLDPEIVSSVLNDCFRGLIAIILKYEGTIDKFIGDEIMAIFGAPLAHENDPERAVRCSFEMLSYINRFNSLSPVQLPIPLNLHIGLHSGMVVAGNVGSDLRMNYSVIGDTVNLASRLVDLAPEGEIHCSADTYRLVSGVVDADGPRPTIIKGKTEHVDLYQLRSLKMGVRPAKAILSSAEFIGREKEISLIDKSLERVRQKKEQRIFVRGEAGVGKTRLKDELIKLARPKGISIFEGRCSSFEIHTPYYLWNTLLKSMLRIGIDTSENETKTRLHDALQIFSLEAHEPYLATLLSLRYEQILLEEDEHRKHKIFESAREVLKAYAQRVPTAFILEDLHWIDRFSQELLEFILTEHTLAPALFFILFRDEYTQAKNIATRGDLIDLNRLSKEEATKLMLSRLDVDEITPNVRELVYRRSEGNPFFIEEILKTLQDKKILSVKKRRVEVLQENIEAGVPETIQGVIMARLDRLEERIKQVLYGASVIGREFSRPILEHVLQKKTPVLPTLRELQALEIILEKEEARELEYLFKHYLIQEVAYNTILQKKRRELHKLIAQAIERLYADKLKEFYELLAFHYEKAEEWEKAAQYLGMAGRKVQEIFTRRESENFYERKNEAVQKLYSAKGVERPWIRYVFQVLTVLVAVPLGLVSIIGIPYVSYGFVKAFHNAIDWIVGLPILLVLNYLAIFGWSVFTTAFIKISFGRSGWLIDIMEDHLLVTKPNGATFPIPFSDVRAFLLKLYFGKGGAFQQRVRSALRRGRGGYNLLHFLTYPWSRHFKKGNINFVQPIVLGMTPKEGVVGILRKTGYSIGKRILMPWLINLPERNRDIGLTPANPSEFYAQFSLAFEKWRRKFVIPDGAGERTSTGEILFSLKPHYGRIKFWGLLGGTVAIILCVFLLAFLTSVVSSGHTLPGRIVGGCIFGLCLYWFVEWLGIPLLRYRKAFQETRFDFFPDRLKFVLGFEGTKSGEILYRDILEVNRLVGFPASLFGTESIEIITAKPVDIAEGRNDLPALLIFDLKNGEHDFKRIRDALSHTTASFEPPYSN